MDLKTVSALNEAANQILAVVAPGISRLVSASVSFDPAGDTACTNGISIWLPPTFEGINVVKNIQLAIGLLVHELGHFLQPLEEITKVEQKYNIPGWLSNIALDIHDEALMASLFPMLANTLVNVRSIVNRSRTNDYRTAIDTAPDFTAGAANLALLGRYNDPQISFDSRPSFGSVSWAQRGQQFLSALNSFHRCRADDLPMMLEYLIQNFPELALTPVPDLPMPPPSVKGKGVGSTAQQQAQQNVKDYHPSQVHILQLVNPKSQVQPDTETKMIAASIQQRFPKGKGAIDIMAPGRVNRHDLAQGGDMPYRMRLPGKEIAVPSVVLCLDKSGSMAGAKFDAASQAGQAIAIAVKAAGGRVVGIQFDEEAKVSKQLDDAMLYEMPGRMGGTDFGFLADAWRRFEGYWFVIVTDGAGNVPFASAPDKERTSVIIIPDGDPDQAKEISNHVIEMPNIKALPYIIANLIPRGMIA